MKNHFITFAFVAVVSIAGLGIAAADEWNKKTIITIDEAMQLPNMTLQPGTYVIKLADSNSDRHIVQFFDKDERHLVTTVLAIPNERLRLTGKSVFAFWEVPAGQPKALRAWFYPGDNFGQEFAYPRQEAAAITASNKGSSVPIDDRPAAGAADSDRNSAATTAGNEPAPGPVAAQPAPVAAPAPVEVAAAAPPPAPQSSSDAAASANSASAATPSGTSSGTSAGTSADTSSDAQRISPTPQQQPDSLPKTASNLPWIVLGGLLSIIGALALNLAYRRS